MITLINAGGLPSRTLSLLLPNDIEFSGGAQRRQLMPLLGGQELLFYQARSSSCLPAGSAPKDDEISIEALPMNLQPGVALHVAPREMHGEWEKG